MSSTIHVALVGITGVGKSTLVNVLNGMKVAKVSNDARPCTAGNTKYEVVEGGAKYCIWDTRGLDEAFERGGGGFLRWNSPEAELKHLLRGNKPRIDLVLLCIDAKKIKVKVHWKIYNKIYADLCERRIRVGIVTTQMDEGDYRGSGWKTTCEVAASGVVDGFPTAELMEAVPKFEGLGDSRVEECKRRIIGLISRACQR